MGQRISARTLKSEMRPHELECLLETIQSSDLKGRFLEIGTAAGGTLVRLMQVFENGARPQFVVLDPMRYFTDQLAAVKRNLTQNGLPPDSVEFKIGQTKDELPRAMAAGETYDFIFIDGNHKIGYVTRDLGWAGLLNVGGLLCLHDYDSGKRGVQISANRFKKRHRNYEMVAHVGSLLILRKTAPSRGPEISGSDHFLASIIAPFLQLEISMNKRLRRRAAKRKASGHGGKPGSQ